MAAGLGGHPAEDTRLELVLGVLGQEAGGREVFTKFMALGEKLKLEWLRVPSGLFCVSYIVGKTTLEQGRSSLFSKVFWRTWIGSSGWVELDS